MEWGKEGVEEDGVGEDGVGLYPIHTQSTNGFNIADTACLSASCTCMQYGHSLRWAALQSRKAGLLMPHTVLCM